VDRGMAYADNLQEIRDRGLHYVVAARQPERDQWLDDFEDPQGFEEMHREPSPRNPFQKKSDVRVKLLHQADECFVLCTSSQRVAKDRAIRSKQELRFLADVEKLRQRIAKGRLVREVAIGEAIGRLKERYPRVARYHLLSYDAVGRQLRHEPDEAKRAKAERLDGGYLLRTDRQDLTGPESWLLYITLTRAEAAFRAMKSPLAERPIFHQLERRVETHIFLCVLAYHLLVAIETTLGDQDQHTSWSTVREVLSTHQVVTIVLPTDEILGGSAHLRPPLEGLRDRRRDRRGLERNDVPPSRGRKPGNVGLLGHDDGRSARGGFERRDRGLLVVTGSEAEDVGVSVRREAICSVERPDESDPPVVEVGTEALNDLAELAVVPADDHENGTLVQKRRHSLDEQIETL